MTSLVLILCNSSDRVLAGLFEAIYTDIDKFYKNYIIKLNCILSGHHTQLVYFN